MHVEWKIISIEITFFRSRNIVDNSSLFRDVLRPHLDIQGVDTGYVVRFVSEKLVRKG